MLTSLIMVCRRHIPIIRINILTCRILLGVHLNEDLQNHYKLVALSHRQPPRHQHNEQDYFPSLEFYKDTLRRFE
jgi:hypothetical protein